MDFSREQNNNSGKPVLNNSIDFNMEIINPDWKSAKPSISTNEFSIIIVKDDGKVEHSEKIKPGHYVNVDDLMSEIDFFSRDIRLSNYNDKDIELARWYASFGGDMISAGYYRAFKYCFKEVAVISETSQGRKGFLRKMLNTIRSENEQKILEPKKSSFWNGKSNGEGGN